MKRFLLLLLLPFVFACSSDSISFRQVGYFKAENRLRYFTFLIDTTQRVSADFSEDDFWKQIKQHGSEQMNTPECVTASFYYIEKAPDISNYMREEDANNAAHEANPIASVWIMPNGQVNLIKQPQ